MGAKTDRRHAQGDESRERILDATIEIAALRGYHGTSIALVSKHSGLPASSIYWHFKSKDDLFAAVIERSFDAWLQSTVLPSMQRPEGEAVQGVERLRSNMREQAKALVINPEFLRLGLLLSLEQHPDEPTARSMFLEVRKRSLEVLVGAFGKVLVEAEGVRDAGLARRLAMLTMAAADGLFIAHQIDPQSIDLSAEFDLLASMVELLVTSPPKPPARRRRA